MHHPRPCALLGIAVGEGGDRLVVSGNGLRGLRPLDGPIDCANAGTLMRLIAGILAGQQGRFELTGDESLSARPMERIAEPLRRMGARIETTDGHAPIVIEGGPLRAIDAQAAGRERAGEVGRAPRRGLRRRAHHRRQPLQTRTTTRS